MTLAGPQVRPGRKGKMDAIIVYADSVEAAEAECARMSGSYPAAVRRVDSGDDYMAWMCFVDVDDARIWDLQI